uniref:Uncharacterized protein n=1 Tax=Rhizophora mucronata TaxID=61149 RepID=A0A2P2QXV1_RHIMU
MNALKFCAICNLRVHGYRVIISIARHLDYE